MALTCKWCEGRTDTLCPHCLGMGPHCCLCGAPCSDGIRDEDGNDFCGTEHMLEWWASQPEKDTNEGREAA